MEVEWQKLSSARSLQILLRTFVDDTVIRVEGAAKQTTFTTIAAAATVCEQLQQAGLVISEGDGGCFGQWDFEGGYSGSTTTRSS
eukprot:9475563-Pyramimonas_sp.AAC.1